MATAACGGGSEEPRATDTPPAATATATPPASTGSDEPPPRDLAGLAARFRGLSDPPRSVELPEPSVGDEQQFSVLVLPANADDPPERRRVSATLRAVSEHAYFFVERGAEVSDDAAEAAVRDFEDAVWPPVTEAFGAPPAPGVDGDPRLVLLHAGLGSQVGGYVSDEDAYPRSVVPTSNQREMIYMDAGITPGSDGYGRVLAHELQHVIQRGHDVDEETWVNEGLSEVAARLLGNDQAFSDTFLERPDTQLNAWAQIQSSGAHYGASSLFFEYLLEQTDGDVLTLASDPANGVDGVRAFLDANGEPRSFPELVADWAVANLVDEGGGPYGYIQQDPTAPETALLEGPTDDQAGVSQFAADYLEVEADDFEIEPVFEFEGARDVPVVAAASEADGAFWWSNRGDNIDSTLTRELDLTGVSEATLTFRLWSDTERWFDYAYVSVSTDGGETWTALPGRATTTDDPLEVSYGPGYTGASGGGGEPQWVDEEIALTPYAGSTVLVRFEYVTDDSTDFPGLAIDDIAVPEIRFADDAESDVGGWERAGFRRVSQPLEQEFQLRLIKFGSGRPDVEAIELDGANRARVTLTGLGTEHDSAVIVIVGATEGTTEPARYRYDIR